jgi:hypothetical protein
MLGSWIYDSTVVVLRLKLHFRSPTQTTIRPPSARHRIMTAIAVSRQTNITCAMLLCVCILLNIGPPIADS